MKILLTGANGYIGRRLLPRLVMNGYEVICMVRDRRRIELEENLVEKVDFVEADLLKPDTLKKIPEDIQAAYYLVHSMGKAGGKFQDLEKKAAQNFNVAMEKTKCKHVVFLSGIVNEESLSRHLKSRLQTEEILQSSAIPVTVLRAAIIIGSGGASFEIIRDLVEKLPIMVAPKWLKTRCQPIAVGNVLEYLEKILLKEEAFHKTFDIGGPDILTYKEMLLQFAQVRHLKRTIISVPVLSPRISSYWLYFIASTSFPLAQSLVDSMKNEVIVQKKGIEKIADIELYNYKQAVERAFDRIAQNEVISSWKDALASSNIDTNLMEYIRLPTYGCFEDRKEKNFDGDIERVINNIWKIGGKTGWYSSRWLWEIRGYIDKVVGGVGLRRGRRSPSLLVPGDALDFWRVLMADRKEGRLLLYAEMRLPGEAWLEFKIDKKKKKLIQTATFRPSGVFGRLYWYSLLPFHGIIFNNMAARIAHK
jgi:uncharacterized protein YbjT (DUF2867 family)